MYHDFIKSRVSFWNSYLICPFPSSMLPLRLWLGFLVGILGLVRLPALLLPVTNLLARMAGRVLCWAVLSLSLPGVWHFVQLPQGLPCDDAFFIIFCTALTAFVLQAHWRHVVCNCYVHAAHSLHFGSSCFNLYGQQPPYQVCVTEGMDHPELDVPLLLHICGEVTSIGLSSDSFNKFVWSLTSFHPDLFQLVYPAPLWYRMIHGDV